MCIYIYIYIHPHTHSFSRTIFHHVLSQEIGYSSLCGTVGPHCISILSSCSECLLSCICRPSSPSSSSGCSIFTSSIPSTSPHILTFYWLPPLTWVLYLFSESPATFHVINAMDQSLLEITFPLHIMTLQFLVLPCVLCMVSDPAQCRHFLSSVLGPFCTLLYPISLDNPAYCPHFNYWLCAENPGPYAWDSQPLSRALSLFFFFFSCVPDNSSMFIPLKKKQKQKKPKQLISILAYLISLSNQFPLMITPAPRPSCWKALPGLAPTSSHSKVLYIPPKSSPSHPSSLSFYSFWPLSKLLSHSGDYVTLSPLQNNIERLHIPQIPLHGFQDHTALTIIYLV